MTGGSVTNNPNGAGWQLGSFILSLYIKHRTSNWFSTNYAWNKDMPCSVSENTIDIEQSNFWSSSNADWDAHRIGWAVAGGSTILVCFIIRKLKCLMLNFNHFTDDTDINRSHLSALQVCSGRKGTEMLNLMRIVLVGITQIQGSSDRCWPLFFNFLIVLADDRSSP